MVAHDNEQTVFIADAINIAAQGIVGGLTRLLHTKTFLLSILQRSACVCTDKQAHIDNFNKSITVKITTSKKRKKSTPYSAFTANIKSLRQTVSLSPQLSDKIHKPGLSAIQQHS